jgi:type IV pilus assembly protein PilE
MIVIAVLGILAAIAWPQYRQYQIRAGRSDARSSLTEGAQRAERFFVRNNTYTGALAAGFNSAEGRYTIAFAVTGGGTGFTLTATPVGGQAEDTLCASMVINNLGQRTARDKDNKDSSTPCW